MIGVEERKRKQREYSKTYRKLHPDKVRDGKRDWGGNNKDKKSEWNKKYYKLNKGEICARSEKWRLENLDRTRENARKWRANNRVKISAYMKKFALTPKGKFHNLVYSAKSRNIPVEFSFEEFADWLSQQESRCHYCGKEVAYGKNGASTFSIDRRDNAVSYELGNIVVACYQCNVIKRDWFSEEQMIKIAEFILKLIGGKDG